LLDSIDQQALVPEDREKGGPSPERFTLPTADHATGLDIGESQVRTEK
jgi:hypothetical protein